MELHFGIDSRCPNPPGVFSEGVILKRDSKSFVFMDFISADSQSTEKRDSTALSHPRDRALRVILYSPYTWYPVLSEVRGRIFVDG